MMPIPTTIVTGPSSGRREAAIASVLMPSLRTALILEGLPDGTSVLAELSQHNDFLSIARIAPGCICCTGNLTMRVTLNRLLRNRPQRLYISLACADHLIGIRQFLLQEPYDKWLSLTNEIATVHHYPR